MDFDQFIEGEDDYAHEEEVLQNPYSFRAWRSYVDAKRSSPPKVRNMIFERALHHLPGSYKLWYLYLRDRIEQVRGLCITDPAVEAANDTFERALVFMHKMPKVWLEYLRFLVRQKLITRTRRAFDRALQALPVTQHNRIWPEYIDFVRNTGVWETAVRVYRRCLQFDPSQREEYIDFLLEIGHFDEAAYQMSVVVNDDSFVSQNGKSRHQLWMDLCDLVSKHPDEIRSLDVEPVIRSGLRRFTDEVGRLWCALADYYIRQGQFERARDIYEEALESVMTVRDFATVYDAYTQFEETVLSAKMELEGDSSKESNGVAERKDEGDDGATTDDDDGEDELAQLEREEEDVDLRMERLELLVDRRPLLLSSVMLRQNPHNVHEWHKRAKLFKDPSKVILCYTEAVKTVDPFRAIGKPHSLWTAFAKYYESHNDLENARVIFQKGTEQRFRHVDDLANLWCDWAEMEIRHDNYQKALEVMQQAVQEPPRRRRRRGNNDAAELSVQDRVHKSTKLWGLYLDLEENLGSVASVRAAYDRAFQLKVATPAMVLNLASYLEERNYFEESFRAYEKGVALFPYPHVKAIWLVYLRKFVDRYQGHKLERTRELFREAVRAAPPESAKPIFLMYADLEEKYGMVRNVMAVYDQAVKSVAEKDKFGLYVRYIRKVEEYYGVTATREVYEAAVNELPDQDAAKLSLQFAAMERRLGEIDRARAIYSFASQFCDPRVDTTFWREWKSFELDHGNAETLREMIRIRNTIAAETAQTNFSAEELRGEAQKLLQEAREGAAGANDEARAGAGGGGAAQKRPGTSLEDLEEAAAAAARTKMARGAGGDRIPRGGGGAAASGSAENPEEMDLDEDAQESTSVKRRDDQEHDQKDASQQDANEIELE